MKRLALYPEIKYNILKEKTSKDIWDKLTNIYASNSLMHRLFLKKELHSMKLEEGGEEQALLMLSSLTTSYKSFVQTMLTGRSTLTCEDVLKALQEEISIMVVRKGDESLKWEEIETSVLSNATIAGEGSYESYVSLIS
uniref:Retrovirus-related Pol polyprotein from transposon TNT 1-94 n=1 Tax=Tanacetum cinerariifolium TaxID=118510 RepID=A0A699QGB0_TANCI|nr:retrovirus-related Pol polyprotein from transposon TNT 1-94 [Tanacetum cinerariifolium]